MYPEKIIVEGELTVNFAMSISEDMSTIRNTDENYLIYDGFSDAILDKVCYDYPTSQGWTSYSPHNYRLKLDEIVVQYSRYSHSFNFEYIENEYERLKLKSVYVEGRIGAVEKSYGFTYLRIIILSILIHILFIHWIEGGICHETHRNFLVGSIGIVGHFCPGTDP